MVATRVRGGAGVVAGMVLLSALVLGVQATADPSEATTADVEEFKVRLINITATYERESWKNNADFYVHGPVNGFSNGSSRFDTALGYHVVLKVGLTDLQGKPVSAGPDIRNVELAAHIDASQGPRQAWIARAPGAAAPVVGQTISDSPEFFLHFDMDGSNAASPQPGAKAPLAFDPGSKLVHVTINRRGVTQTVERVGGNDLLFAYDAPRQHVTVSSLSEPYLSRVPDSIFRQFTDIGKDNTILFVQNPVAKNANLSVTYEFGKIGATVRWYAFAAHQSCDTPSGASAPNCGPVLIYRRLHRTGTTDLDGNVTFEIGAGDLLQFPGRNFGSAIVVLAAALEPQDPAAPALPSEYAAGSPTLLTGAMEFALPITDRTSRVSKYTIETQRYENASGRAPDPVAQAILQANYLEVQFYDDSQSSSEGDVWAVVPARSETGSAAALANGRIGRHQDATSFPNFRVGRLPVPGIQAGHTPNYRVLGFLYAGPPGLEFQSLAWGDRGYVANFGLPPTTVQANGKLWINLTSVNTNYDGVANEPGFNLKVLMRVVIPELQKNQILTIEIPEGATTARSYPVSSSRVADVKVTLNATTGDTIADWTETLQFIEPVAKKTFADRIPGFDAAFAAFAVAAVGAVLWRRRSAG